MWFKAMSLKNSDPNWLEAEQVAISTWDPLGKLVGLVDDVEGAEEDPKDDLINSSGASSTSPSSPHALPPSDRSPAFSLPPL